MNLRICKRQFFQKSSIRLIFISAICTLVYHKNFFKSATHHEVPDAVVEGDLDGRNPLFWRPLIGSPNDHILLPKLVREEKEPREVEVDQNELKRELYRKLANVPFMDILDDEIPPHIEIDCRPDLGLRIPNVVHFVWFGPLNLKYQQYLSIRSAAAVQKPTKLYLHLDMEHAPSGPHWERLRAEVPCLEIRRHDPPEEIFGHKLQHVAHKSDILRMELLYNEGGIYADINVYFLNPMDPLMNNSFVIGKEEKGCYGNSVMLSEPGAPFLKLWYENYESFKPEEWNEHSTHLPVRLHQQNPDIEIHVDEFSIMRPNYRDGIDWILRKNWDLSYNYCVHLYVNTFPFDFAPIFAMDEGEIVRINSTFGQMARKALFGKLYLETEDRKNITKIQRIECQRKVETSGIPNILHFIWHKRKFTYHNYLSLRSAARVFKPESIMFHMFGSEKYEENPFDPLWVRLNHEVPCITVNRLPLKFAGDPHLPISLRILKIKLALILLHGGTALDPDTIFLHPFTEESLTSYDSVISLDDDPLANLVVTGKQNSLLLQQWLDLLDQNVTDANIELQNMINTMPELGAKVILTPAIAAPESWLYNDGVVTGDAAAYYFDYWKEIINYNKTEAFTIQQKTPYGELARLTMYGET